VKVTDGLISYLGNERSTSRAKGADIVQDRNKPYNHLIMGYLAASVRVSDKPATAIKLHNPAHSLQSATFSTRFAIR